MTNETMRIIKIASGIAILVIVTIKGVKTIKIKKIDTNENPVEEGAE